MTPKPRKPHKPVSGSLSNRLRFVPYDAGVEMRGHMGRIARGSNPTAPAYMPNVFQKARDARIKSMFRQGPNPRITNREQADYRKIADGLRKKYVTAADIAWGLNEDAYHAAKKNHLGKFRRIILDGFAAKNRARESAARELIELELKGEIYAAPALRAILAYESSPRVIHNILRKLLDLSPTNLRSLLNGPPNWEASEFDPAAQPPGGIGRMLRRLEGRNRRIDVLLNRIKVKANQS